MIGLALGAGLFIPSGRGASLRAALRRYRLPLVLALLAANAPDLDYLPGIAMGSLNAAHRWYTHTLGWTLLAALALWMMVRLAPADELERAGLGRPGWRLGLGLAVIALSHLAADWVTEDLRPPYGIMALWPINNRFYIAGHTIFPHLQKADFGQIFRPHNAWAVLVECAWGLPLLLAVLFYKQARIRHARRSGTAS